MAAPASEIKGEFDLWMKEREDMRKRVVRPYTYRCFGDYKQRLNLEHLIEEAFVDVFMGIRHIPPDKDPAACMCMIVKSKFRNWFEKENLVGYVEDIPDSDLSDVFSENRYFIRRMLREMVEGDLILMRMVEVLIQCPDAKSDDFVSELGLSPEEVHNAKRRLVRKIRRTKGIDTCPKRPKKQ